MPISHPKTPSTLSVPMFDSTLRTSCEQNADHARADVEHRLPVNSRSWVWRRAAVAGRPRRPQPRGGAQIL